jgi:crotonobetainyl-CoA:carnitine CoA-transferase CaiB-like acyl-CoA transferase
MPLAIFRQSECQRQVEGLYGFVPHLPESPGRVRWTRPRIGQHTQEVLGEILGMSADEIAAL